MQDLCIWLAHRRTESLERDDPSKAPPAKPSPNSDDAGPIVRRPIGLQILAGCDTTRDRTQVCCDASSTALNADHTTRSPKKKKPEGEEITRNEFCLPFYLYIKLYSRGPCAFQVK
jgi:hypothetical protein